MTIKPYACYEDTEVLPLYEAVGWTNYTNTPQMLKAAYAGSLCIFAAYEDNGLVGLIRAVGDGASILFIQDLLVLPEFQRRGIGTMLVRTMLNEYPNVYQVQLATDGTEKAMSFYKSLGFVPLSELGCCGLIKHEI